MGSASSSRIPHYGCDVVIALSRSTSQIFIRYSTTSVGCVSHYPDVRRHTHQSACVHSGYICRALRRAPLLPHKVSVMLPSDRTSLMSSPPRAAKRSPLHRSMQQSQRCALNTPRLSTSRAHTVKPASIQQGCMSSPFS